MAAPYHSEIPITYLEVEQPKANEIVLSYIRQKMLITMDKGDHTCNDDTNYNLRSVCQYNQYFNVANFLPFQRLFDWYSVWKDRLPVTMEHLEAKWKDTIVQE